MRVATNCKNKPLNKPFSSNRGFKKKQVCVKDTITGNVKNVHYGDKRYSDYTKHGDKKRRANFRARHNCDPVSKLDKTTPRYWACQDLW